MSELKAGTRLKSVAGGAEVIVTIGGDGVITCGGSPMLPSTAAAPSTSPKSGDVDEPRLVLGKRYRTADRSVEVLCVRQGTGALQLDGAPMDLLTQLKPLPASD